MKVTIPENRAELTLGKYQSYAKILEDENADERTLNNNAVSIFYDIPLDQVENISKNDYDFLLNSILQALNKEVEFVNTFKMDGVEYGFIPSLNNDDITTKEFIDLQLYPFDKIETHNKLMAILFRPVTKKDGFGSYEIEPYTGTKATAEKMKGMPMSVVDGALLFFLTLLEDLLNASQKFTEVQPVKV